MKLNPNVTIDLESYNLSAHFYPAEGYALYEDDEESNMNPETGEIICYWKHLSCLKTEVEDRAPHIWAKLIEPDITDCENAVSLSVT